MGGLTHRHQWPQVSPIRATVAVQNLDYGAEIKLVYNLNPHMKEQHYSCEVFLFFSEELESEDLGFYHNLWTNVRLHTPKVAPLSQSGSHKQDTTFAF